MRRPRFAFAFKPWALVLLVVGFSFSGCLHGPADDAASPAGLDNGRSDRGGADGGEPDEGDDSPVRGDGKEDEDVDEGWDNGERYGEGDAGGAGEPGSGGGSGEDNGQSDNDNDNENENGGDPSSSQALALEVLNPVHKMVEGESRNFQVQVTGDGAEADWAGIRWANATTTDKGSLDVGHFDGQQAADGDNHSFPGEFTVGGWSLDPGNYFVRAHAQVEGGDFWSDEFEVQVVPVVEEGDFDADHTVTIKTGFEEGFCQYDAYDPETLEMKVGETVQWFNGGQCVHSATHDAQDYLWDTGSIPVGESSEYSYRFNKAGTYDVISLYYYGVTAKIVVS